MSDLSTTSVQTEGCNLSMADAAAGSNSVPSSGWHNLDPNSYGEFGPSYKKTPRDPISQQMQMQKGMLTDMDSGIAFEVDITMDNVDRFGPYMYRCSTKHCGNTGQSLFRPTGVTAGGSGGFTVLALGALAERFLVVARGSNKDENNGLYMVQSGSTNTNIRVSGTVLETSPPTNFRVDLAGYRGEADDIFLDTDGNLNTNGAVDFTDWNVNDGQWLYLGGEDDANRFATAEFFGAARIAVDGITADKITFDAHNWDVQAHAWLDLTDVALQLDSVVEAILSGPGGNSITVASTASGTAAAKAELNLGAGHTAHVDTVIRAKVGGTDGNSITVEIVGGAVAAAGVKTEIGTHVKLQIKTTSTSTTVAQLEALIGTCSLIEVKTTGTGATSLDGTDVMASLALAGGTNATAASVTEVGDAVTLHFTSGHTTVAEMEAAITSTSTKIRIKREGTANNVLAVTDDDFSATNLENGNDGSDDGAGKQIDVYFTRWWHNTTRKDPDFNKGVAVFEVEYPELDDGNPKYEYIVGNALDSCVINLPTTSKATMQLGFKGTKTLPLTSIRKAGPANAIDPVTKLGVSTATDLQRLRVANVDDTGIASDLVTAKITINNNISPEKQLGTLGARRINHGSHYEKFDADVIFVTSAIVDGVRDNRTAGFSAQPSNQDFSCVFDMQAMTLDTAGRKMERNKSVKISSTGSGHEHDEFGSTGSLSMFAFCPAAPEED